VTFGQYKRLLLVVSLPLLLIGSGLAFAVSPFPKWETIVCSGSRWCRTVVESEFINELENVVNSGKEYLGDDLTSFPVSLPTDSFRFGRYDIQSVGAAVKDVRIVAYQPYVHSSQAANTLAASWVGTQGNIVLGFGRPGRSVYGGGYPLSLVCSGLEILDDQGLYRATCVMREPGDGGSFTFSSPRDDDTQFVHLIEHIEETVADSEFDRIMYIVLVYPSLLYGFIILSGLVWLGKRAKAFVVAG